MRVYFICPIVLFINIYNIHLYINGLYGTINGTKKGQTWDKSYQIH